MVTHSSIPAWKIPRTEEPGSPWGHKESDTTETSLSLSSPYLRVQYGFNELRNEKYIKRFMNHSEHSRILAVRFAAPSSFSIPSPPGSVHGTVGSLDQPLACSVPQPSLVQILGFFKLQLKCLVLLELSFIVFFLLSCWAAVSSQPLISLALIILGTAAPHIVFGCLWEYLTCRFQANHFWSISLGFPKLEAHGASGHVCPIPVNDLEEEEEMGWGRHSGTTHKREGGPPVERWGMR